MSGRLRTVVALAVLAALYMLVIAAGNSRAWSGSDAGGKVATVKHMADDRLSRPDVGYWAERWDPDGANHPLIYTRHVGGRWLQVTSLPFVYLGVPLYDAGGTAGLLLLPLAGSLIAAYGGRRLALALGARSGWGAFWLVGTATPMLFYAGDFWEHSAAVGLALLALALALDGGTPRALAAGLLGGVAIVLRTEMVLYAVALGVGLVLLRDERRAWLRKPARLVLLVMGTSGVLVANAVAERALLGAGLRDARAAENMAAAGQGLGQRLSDGLLTALGLLADDTGRTFVAGGLLLVALLIAAGGAVQRGRAARAWRVGVAGAIALYLVRAIQGLGFVPGCIPAAPVSAAGLTGAQRGRQRAVACAALVALPAVWLLSWRGQLIPQWGGRYVLLTGALLTVVGAVALERVGWRQPAVIALVGLGVAVTAFSAAWHVERTNDVAAAFTRIDRAPDDVVIVSGVAHLAREGGAFYGDRRWLTSVTEQGLDEAVAVARRAGIARIDVIATRATPTLAGWRSVGVRRVDFLDVELTITRYARAALR
jgi:hypothetical protein